MTFAIPAEFLHCVADVLDIVDPATDEDTVFAIVERLAKTDPETALVTASSVGQALVATITKLTDMTSSQLMTRLREEVGKHTQ